MLVNLVWYKAEFHATYNMSNMLAVNFFSATRFVVQPHDFPINMENEPIVLINLELFSTYRTHCY
jgi:hypothetical protein